MLGPEWGAATAPILLFVALLIDGLMPGGAVLARIVPPPRRIVAAIARDLDRRLNREKRGEKTRVLRGAILTMVLAGCAAGFGWGIARLGQTMPYGWIVEPVFLATLIAQRGLYSGARNVARALRSGQPDAARAALRTLSTGPAVLESSKADAHTLARAAIEAISVRLADRVVAPVFWYMLLGLPGALAQVTVNATAAVIGQPTRRHAAFGLAATRLDDVLSAIPARLAALALVAAAIVTPGANPVRAARTMWRGAGLHPSLNAGWPLGATAGALDLALAGPLRGRSGPEADMPWIGDGRARAEASDVSRALYLFAVTCLIEAGIVAAAALLALQS